MTLCATNNIWVLKLSETISLRHVWSNETARKASWNNLGVEPGNQEGPGCWDLGRVLVLIKNTRFVRDNGKQKRGKQKRGTGVKTPSPRSFWCGTVSLCATVSASCLFKRQYNVLSHESYVSHTHGTPCLTHTWHTMSHTHMAHHVSHTHVSLRLTHTWYSMSHTHGTPCLTHTRHTALHIFQRGLCLLAYFTPTYIHI